MTDPRTRKFLRFSTNDRLNPAWHSALSVSWGDRRTYLREFPGLGCLVETDDPDGRGAMDEFCQLRLQRIRAERN